MRTTVELPPDLFRAAKARSAQTGESLKTLITRALAAELGRAPAGPSARARVALPLFGRAGGRRQNPSNADLEQALADADAIRAVSRRAARPPR